MCRAQSALHPAVSGGESSDPAVLLHHFNYQLRHHQKLSARLSSNIHLFPISEQSHSHKSGEL